MMDPDPIRITAERVFLVEGRSDVGFFQSLFARHGRSGVQVVAYGGKTRLKSRLRAIADQADFQERCRWLGIARDADDSAADSFRSIANALRESGQPVPESPSEIATDGYRQVRVIIVPLDGGGKELEDQVWSSIVQSQPHEAGCVAAMFDCLRGSERNVNRSPKAHVYAYLSTSNPPDRSLGEAANSGDGIVPLDSSHFHRFLDLVPRDDEPL